MRAVGLLWIMGAVTITIWLLAGSVGLAGKDRSDPFVEKIERERRALEKLKGEIEEKKKRALETEKKKESVLQAIQDLDAALALKRRERVDINRKLKQKDREIEAITAQLAALHTDIGERRRSILARVRTQYIEGRFGALKALLAAKDYETLQRRFRYLSAISEREYDLIQSYRRDAERLEEMERQRAQARREMLDYKQRTDKKLAEIEGLKRQKHAVLVRVTQEKESYDRMVAELERSAARVDGILRELEQRRRATAFQPQKDVRVVQPVKGVLQWPADGEVISFFGRQKHKNFETYIQRKGIEIRTEEGSAIRAVMPGTVVYADWLKGYGQVVILDHLNGFFSLYAHASTLLVKVGERVEAGHIIGETGDTGLTGDSTLYFELREGAEPVDPLLWLAKRR